MDDNIKELLYIIFDFFINKRDELYNKIKENEEAIKEYETSRNTKNIIVKDTKDGLVYVLNDNEGNLIIETKILSELDSFLSSKKQALKKEIIEKKKMNTLHMKNISKIDFIIDNPKKITAKLDMDIGLVDGKNNIDIELGFKDKMISHFFDKFTKELSLKLKERLNDVSTNIISDKVIDTKEQKIIDEINQFDIKDNIEKDDTLETFVNEYNLENGLDSDNISENINNDNEHIDDISLESDDFYISNIEESQHLSDLEDVSGNIVDFENINEIDNQEINDFDIYDDTFLDNTNDLLSENIDKTLDEDIDLSEFNELSDNGDIILNDENSDIANSPFDLDDDNQNNLDLLLENIEEPSNLDENIFDSAINSDTLEETGNYADNTLEGINLEDNELLNTIETNNSENIENDIFEGLDLGNTNSDDLDKDNNDDIFSELDDFNTVNSNTDDKQFDLEHTENTNLDDLLASIELGSSDNDLLNSIDNNNSDDILVDTNIEGNIIDDDIFSNLEDTNSSDLLNSIDTDIENNSFDSDNDLLNSIEIDHIDDKVIVSDLDNDLLNSIESDNYNILEDNILSEDKINETPTLDNEKNNIEDDIFNNNDFTFDEKSDIINTKISEDKIDLENRIDNNIIPEKNDLDDLLDSAISNDYTPPLNNSIIEKSSVDLLNNESLLNTDIKKIEEDPLNSIPNPKQKELDAEEELRRKKYEEDKMWKDKLFSFLENSKKINLNTFKTDVFPVRKSSFLDNYSKKEKILGSVIFVGLLLFVFTMVGFIVTLGNINEQSTSDKTQIETELAKLKSENAKLKDTNKTADENYKKLQEDSKPITGSNQISLLNIDQITINKKEDPDLKKQVYSGNINNYLSLYPKVIPVEIGDLISIKLKNGSEIIYKVKKSYNGNNLPSIVDTAEKDQSTSVTGFIIVAGLNSEGYYIAVPIQ